jgi:hypothetical protein
VLSDEHPADRVGEQVAGHRHSVAGRGGVHRAPVSQRAGGVVQEEVGGARGTEGPPNVLGLVDQVGEGAGAPDLLAQAGRVVGRVGGGVVGADTDDPELRRARNEVGKPASTCRT